MTVLIDPPTTAGHGRLWSHLASDSSYDELHVFAQSLGVPRRGFDGDHYDVPAEWYEHAVAAGAVPVSSRELVSRLTVAGLRRRKAERPRPRRAGRPLLAPPRLRAGDQVAVVAPAGRAASDAVAAGVEVLRGWGLDVVGPDGTGSPDDGAMPWLAGSDQSRAGALVRAWTGRDVRAVWVTRGGFGSQRLLELVDWRELAAAGPKLLVGYSDITALHQAVAARLGLVTIHGPGVAGLCDLDESAREAVRELVFDGRTGVLRGTSVVPGVARGPLVGGNLTVLASSLGTPLVHAAAGSVAVLEDVGEAPYRLDRALTQLLRGGWFTGVRGVVTGTFTRCGDPDQVRSLLVARLQPLGVPVVIDAPFGHVPQTRSLPLGAVAQLDGEAGTLLTHGPVLR